MCLKFFHSLIRLARENDIAQIYGSWFLSHFGGGAVSLSPQFDSIAIMSNGKFKWVAFLQVDFSW